MRLDSDFYHWLRLHVIHSSLCKILVMACQNAASKNVMFGYIIAYYKIQTIITVLTLHDIVY